MNKMLVTVICQLVIFWATMSFSANFTVIAVMLSTKALAENDDFVAGDSILLIGHRLVCNGLQRQFYRKRSKMSF